MIWVVRNDLEIHALNVIYAVRNDHKLVHCELALDMLWLHHHCILTLMDVARELIVRYSASRLI